MKHLAEDLNDVVKIEKKDLLGKIETQGNELKRKIEMETNEIRWSIKKKLSERNDSLLCNFYSTLKQRDLMVNLMAKSYAFR